MSVHLGYVYYKRIIGADSVDYDNRAGGLNNSEGLSHPQHIII